MGVDQILMAALAVLATYAAFTSRSLLRTGGLPVQAPPPAVGALRITRSRLAHGEIDLAEYERIKAVLLERIKRFPA
ncbi:MAG TPA: SHOCT domain-containing protein [Coriobacteriia bacterium]|nr:SHOCT domain-containing protein [Coriobacteriia bacterium]